MSRPTGPAGKLPSRLAFDHEHALCQLEVSTGSTWLGKRPAALCGLPILNAFKALTVCFSSITEASGENSQLPVLAAIEARRCDTRRLRDMSLFNLFPV